MLSRDGNIVGFRGGRGSTSRRSRRCGGTRDGWWWGRDRQRIGGQGRGGAIKASVDILEVVGGGEAREGTPDVGWCVLAGVLEREPDGSGYPGKVSQPWGHLCVCVCMFIESNLGRAVAFFWAVEATLV